ncbi:hypothetical protein B0H13DRAFT_2549543 [Mycena leptocephala]|nr:hypothetical protein B0H13DRAFT_2549543 [Mycena leptocephala]
MAKCAQAFDVGAIYVFDGPSERAELRYTRLEEKLHGSTEGVFVALFAKPCASLIAEFAQHSRNNILSLRGKSRSCSVGPFAKPFEAQPNRRILHTAGANKESESSSNRVGVGVGWSWGQTYPIYVLENKFKLVSTLEGEEISAGVLVDSPGPEGVFVKSYDMLRLTRSPSSRLCEACASLIAEYAHRGILWKVAVLLPASGVEIEYPCFNVPASNHNCVDLGVGVVVHPWRESS